MSNSNQIRVSIVQESTFGVTPASPTMLILPTTGQSLRDRLGYQQSQTIRSDRNVQDLIRLSKAAGGGIPCEFTYSASGEALFSAIRAILCSSETAATTQVTGVSCTSDVLSGGSGNVETGIEVGDIVRVLTSADVLVSYAKVVALDVGAHTVTVETGSLANGTNYKVLRGARMKNGTTERSFTIEVARLDLQKAQIFTGCTFDSMDFNIADEAITTASFSVQAQSSTRVSALSTDVFITSATYTAPVSNPVLDSIAVPEIRVAGATYAAKAIGMSFSNNVAPRTQIGALGPQSMRFGQFGASGRVTAYMDGFDDFDDYANNTAADMWLAMIDPSNKGWSFSFPQTKYSDVGADTRGPNQDDLKELAVTAYADPTESCTLRVQRWA